MKWYNGFHRYAQCEFVSIGGLLGGTECRAFGKVRTTGRVCFREFLHDGIEWLVNPITEEIKNKKLECRITIRWAKLTS